MCKYRLASAAYRYSTWSYATWEAIIDWLDLVLVSINFEKLITIIVAAISNEYPPSESVNDKQH